MIEGSHQPIDVVSSSGDRSDHRMRITFLRHQPMARSSHRNLLKTSSHVPVTDRLQTPLGSFFRPRRGTLLPA